ncbi:FG-GAP-like repeat-containing protein [Mobilicoccus massiliensis]|uniref:FG-GAP-like repeat-containing protein n=1 Tax=Mobilicoccus massiliensis TaxID=1522310 RepID=UPI001144F4D1|nr:FG-GAP-like repeat-containing protein [Mobilicoccus massiliensis]
MRLRRLSTLTAATMLAPAFWALPAQGEPNQKPVETTQEAAALVDPADPAVGDGDYATSQDIALAKDKTPEVARERDLAVLGATGRQAVESSLAVIGVTWEGDTPLAVQYRTEGPKGWGAWQGIDTSSEGDGVESQARTRAGSDPIVLTGATAVQARILGAPGDAPRNPTLAVIDPGHGEGDANTGVQAGAAQAAASRPTIRSRAQWGADESIRKGSPSYGVVRGAIVHHTAGTNNYSPSQVPAILRGIYAFHVKDRGWSDIGYNFLVDKWGRVWEGRYGGTNRSLVGAQASGFNGVTMGISVMGDYRYVNPPQASIDAVTRVIAWKASIHGFDPRGRFTHNGKSYRNVSGHRDVGQTSCPGLIYNYLPAMATRAAALKGGSSLGNTGGSAQVGGTTRPPAVGSPPSGGLNVADAMLLGTTGKLFAVSPAGAASISYARALDQRSWRGYDRILVTQDISGDRFPDLLTRGRQDGRLYVHPGRGTGVAARTSLGGGWNAMAHIVAPGDWTGDGRADLITVQKSDGKMYLYPGKGNNKFGSRVAIGQAWGGMAHVLAVGDWSGDRKPDLVGITASGQAYLYRGDGRGRFTKATKSSLGSVKGYSRFVGMTGTGRILAVRADGSAAVLRPSGNGMAATAVSPNFRGLTVFGG